MVHARGPTTQARHSLVQRQSHVVQGCTGQGPPASLTKWVLTTSTRPLHHASLHLVPPVVSAETQQSRTWACRETRQLNDCKSLATAVRHCTSLAPSQAVDAQANRARSPDAHLCKQCQSDICHRAGRAEHMGPHGRPMLPCAEGCHVCLTSAQPCVIQPCACAE